MDSSKKLYIAILVLAVLGGGLYLQNQKQAEDERSHSFNAKLESLPQIAVTSDDKNAIDSIEISREPKEKDEPKSEGDAGAKAVAEQAAPTRETVKFKKAGEDAWEISEPMQYKANGGNIKSLLDNLEKLKITEEISKSKDDYDKWGVSDEKALHAVVKKGDQTLLDIYVGDSGSRGQMVRLGGQDGVFAVKGYSDYLYARELKNWREKGIFKFEDADIVKVNVTNEHGVFDFEKQDGQWTSKHAEKAGAAAKEIPRFKPTKIDDLIRAYKALNASDFGDGKSLTDVGLDAPKATVTLEAKGDSAKYVLMVGDNSEGESRWVRANNSEQIYSVSSWTANWATAEPSKFQEAEPKAEDASGAAPGAAEKPAAEAKKPAAPTKDKPVKASTPAPAPTP